MRISGLVDAKEVQNWIAAVGARTAYIAPGSSWENGFIESFNARRRDELDTSGYSLSGNHEPDKKPVSGNVQLINGEFSKRSRSCRL